MNSSRRILVLDDDANLLIIMRYILEEADWKVVTAEKCNDAIDLIIDFNPSVILIDNKIPDYGGIYTTRLIKQYPQFRHIPIILLTANPDIRELADEAGADAYLAKPFNLTRLYEIIDDFTTNT